MYETIISLLLHRFGLTVDRINYIGGAQNKVYECFCNEKSIILRLSPQVHRNEQMVLAELEWIVYLSQNNISVSKPIASVSGSYTNLIEIDGQYYITVAFEKAEGRAVGYPECLESTDLYYHLGKLTGKLHRLSTRYVPKKYERHSWQHNWFLQHLDLLPSTQIQVRASFEKLKHEINQLPQDKQSFGLIHGDINVGNFRVNDEEDKKITLFDFDEAQYSWFVEDIAIQLYYVVYVYGGADGNENRERQARLFMKPFMEGYQTEYELDEYWLKQIPLFLRLRELIVYIGSFRNFDGDETFKSSNNEWLIDWIAESRERIEKGIAVVDIWQ